MKLTAKIKLNPTPEQHDLLLQTLEQANAACNHISQQAWAYQTFNKYKLQDVLYQTIKADFGLTAQMVIRCLAKVGDAYKLDRKKQRAFRPHGAIAYDSRILRYIPDEQSVSIWTIAGRQVIPYLAGARQLDLLQGQRGESDLVFIDGSFYLYATCEVDEPEIVEPSDFLGVDLGVTNIAVDSDGDIHKGSHVNHVRVRYVKLRQKLQKKGTKSSKRLLKKRRRKEKRFVHDVNHCISKQLVKKAQGTGRGIALEDLQGIRERVTVRKSQRLLLHSWSFADLQHKIAYKAARSGVQVVFVNPAYTSQTCCCCGHIAKSNRRSQSQFQCTSCGYAAHADVNAAQNIRVPGRVSVNAPYADSDLGSIPA